MGGRRRTTVHSVLGVMNKKERIATKISRTTYSSEVHEQFTFHARQSLCNFRSSFEYAPRWMRTGACIHVVLWIVHRSAVHRAKPFLWRNESRQSRSLFAYLFNIFNVVVANKNRNMICRIAYVNQSCTQAMPLTMGENKVNEFYYFGRDATNGACEFNCSTCFVSFTASRMSFCASGVNQWSQAVTENHESTNGWVWLELVTRLRQPNENQCDSSGCWTCSNCHFGFVRVRHSLHSHKWFRSVENLLLLVFHSAHHLFTLAPQKASKHIRHSVDSWTRATPIHPWRYGCVRIKCIADWEPNSRGKIGMENQTTADWHRFQYRLRLSSHFDFDRASSQFYLHSHERDDASAPSKLENCKLFFFVHRYFRYSLQLLDYAFGYEGSMDGDRRGKWHNQEYRIESFRSALRWQQLNEHANEFGLSHHRAIEGCSLVASKSIKPILFAFACLPFSLSSPLRIRFHLWVHFLAGCKRWIWLPAKFSHGFALRRVGKASLAVSTLRWYANHITYELLWSSE